MISSNARPYGQKSGRSLVARYPKTTLALGGFLLIAVVASIVTHPGTYNVALASMSSQPVIQISSKQPTAKPINQTNTTKVLNQSTLDSNITKNLTRIYQLDPAQYNGQQEYNTWAMSACSVAAMTEVINAWSVEPYRITDVLTQAQTAQAITPDAGLVDSGGIERTMIRFGFDTEWGNNKWSLDQLINIAKQTPVIVSFPPDKVPGGHILVLRGGDATTVLLTDSSKLDTTVMSRTNFNQLWEGFAAIAKRDSYSLMGKPTISVTHINTILSAYGSPMQNQGQQIYNITTQYNIDPTGALSFYLHESTMGTAGVAKFSHSWGNLRCINGAACINNTDGGICLAGQSCYAAFPNGIEGLTAWCKLITSKLYFGNGLVLYKDIIPVYAPSSDNNNEDAYINSLKQTTDLWRAGKIKA